MPKCCQKDADGAEVLCHAAALRSGGRPEAGARKDRAERGTGREGGRGERVGGRAGERGGGRGIRFQGTQGSKPGVYARFEGS